MSGINCHYSVCCFSLLEKAKQLNLYLFIYVYVLDIYTYIIYMDYKPWVKYNQ